MRLKTVQAGRATSKPDIDNPLSGGYLSRDAPICPCLAGAIEISLSGLTCRFACRFFCASGLALSDAADRSYHCGYPLAG